MSTEQNHTELSKEVDNAILQPSGKVIPDKLPDWFQRAWESYYTHEPEDLIYLFKNDFKGKLLIGNFTRIQVINEFYEYLKKL